MCHCVIVKWAAYETDGSTRSGIRVATKRGSFDKEDHLGDKFHCLDLSCLL